MDGAADGMAPRLSVVVLAYNEELTLEGVVLGTVEACQSIAGGFEVIVIDDASTDGTAALGEGLADRLTPVRYLRHRGNQGSGMAIRSGIAAARGEHIIYVPGDGQFDVGEIGRFLDAARHADIVIGARAARSDYTRFRLVSSRVFLLLVRALFGTRVEDVNWVHLWHRRVFEQFAVRSRGVFLLEEILVRADRHGMRLVELDSAYRPRQGGQATGGHPRTILRTLREMACLRVELWVR